MQNKPSIFFGTEASQIGGVGGGPTFGKNSQKIPYFFLRGSLISMRVNVFQALLKRKEFQQKKKLGKLPNLPPFECVYNTEMSHFPW